jgi:hypothetical protein
MLVKRLAVRATAIFERAVKVSARLASFKLGSH